jgi:hypothetical protein
MSESVQAERARLSLTGGPILLCDRLFFVATLYSAILACILR